jgi:hypothetical protein
VRGAGTLAISLCVVLLPTVALAQASIAGVVRGSSGAVLPGVTVEASSPALIEKVRSAVSDGSGQYRIVDLRPGVYSVTFALTGFNAFKRDGVERQGSFVATVNADQWTLGRLTLHGGLRFEHIGSYYPEASFGPDLYTSQSG